LPAVHGRRGPALPYTTLAGVEPCPGGWLVATARLSGVTAFPQPPEVLADFSDVLDYRPAFDVLALHLPIGLLDTPRTGGRACDREARRLLGWRRSGTVASPPARSVLTAYAAGRRVDVSPVVRPLLGRLVDVYGDMGPYRQRTLHEVNPELGYFQLNDSVPLTHRKRTPAGLAERRALIEARMQGVEVVLDARLPRVGAHHLLDVAVDLWTARRIAARAAVRLPEDPEWDDEGLRMEILL
jgi:predicted RNase H-like nuclease